MTEKHSSKASSADTRRCRLDATLADEASRVALSQRGGRASSTDPADPSLDPAKAVRRNIFRSHGDKEYEFFDMAGVHVAGGAGGNCCVAFRREKGVAMWGPNGDRGGSSGAVLFGPPQ